MDIAEKDNDAHSARELNILQQSICIEIASGASFRLIERGVSLPARAVRIFSTTEDNQSKIETHILQGESSNAGENTSICQATVLGIPPAPRGVPQIEVVFAVNEKGVFYMEARDKTGGRQIQVTMDDKLKSN